jgi:hypothetical protein
MTVELVEIAPNRWRFVREQTPPARSDLPCPYIISDEMPSTEQVDGRFYTSKSTFRAVGKAHGLVEVGNEKLKPRQRLSQDPAYRRRRKQDLKDAVEKVRAGHYERYFHPDGTSRRQRAAAAAASTDRSQDT